MSKPSPKVGDRVVPTAQLRRFGPSAFDKGATVTRVDSNGAVWARPTKSTRPAEIGAKGFGWLWSNRKEYRSDPGDLEPDDVSMTPSDRR